VSKKEERKTLLLYRGRGSPCWFGGWGGREVADANKDQAFKRGKG